MSACEGPSWFCGGLGMWSAGRCCLGFAGPGRSSEGVRLGLGGGWVVAEGLRIGAGPWRVVAAGSWVVSSMGRVVEAGLGVGGLACEVAAMLN
jgi:hypothetical protein